MNIIFRKSSASLAPASGQSNSYRIKYRCLSSIVRPDKHGRLAQRDIKLLDGSEILDLQMGQSH
jgi:hypothetical protein